MTNCLFLVNSYFKEDINIHAYNFSLYSNDIPCPSVRMNSISAELILANKFWTPKNIRENSSLLFYVKR